MKILRHDGARRLGYEGSTREMSKVRRIQIDRTLMCGKVLSRNVTKQEFLPGVTIPAYSVVKLG